ncbi:hypothetical protein PG985_003085 [Apiospora marii]|uniref:uncharacterized protein n=1 Tax=Apiospora marii TaxID=335849 RepID=UPI00312E9AE7
MSSKLPEPPPMSVAVRKGGMGPLQRLPVSVTPLNHIYKRIKTIDDGKGGLGGMNSGVYIVRQHHAGPLYVEKCYRSDNIKLIKLFREEIGYMRKLMHSGIVQYVHAYVNIKPPYEAAAYMEYCDRGSLKDMIQIYSKERKMNHDHHIPESFIWHSFLGLADVLYFLNTGQSFISMELQKNDPKKWMPIIHRDIKPDRYPPPETEQATHVAPRLTPNPDIFLRSRDTPNSPKPPYVLLSDFGIACREDASSGPDSGGPCSAAGTMEYHAPELCFDPRPTAHQATHQQASPHTSRSDVFAVALAMYCLCERACFPHIDARCLPLRSPAALGRAARPARLAIGDRGVYSDYLARTIEWAGAREPWGRPDAPGMVEGVQRQCRLWRGDPNWQQQVAEVLPEWAAPRRTVK